MYTPEDIQRCFDAKTLDYLERKNQGGSSGQMQSGTPPYSVETEAFRRLQERIKDRRPTTFEELENLL